MTHVPTTRLRSLRDAPRGCPARSRQRVRWHRGLWLAMSSWVWGVPGGCGDDCRAVEHRALAIDCEGGFSGELHFDAAATFDTFLQQRCLLAPSDAEVAGLLASVDFSDEAVVVASRPRTLADGRCIATRSLADVSVCGDGLRVDFVDAYETALDACPVSNWTVAFVLSRDDLRTALVLPESP